MIRVMISGHFDGFHGGHLDYIKQAMQYGDIVCVVTSDNQLKMKKGRIIQTEYERKHIVYLILVALSHLKAIVSSCSDDCCSNAYINHWDEGTTLVTEALRKLKPDIFFRGYDKTLETMPVEERKVCEELGIKIIHAKNRIGERHGSEMTW